jgi:hypothetical protein
MPNVETNQQPANPADENPPKQSPQAIEGEEEFQITVKKLDFVVKPRGVLAE